MLRFQWLVALLCCLQLGSIAYAGTSDKLSRADQIGASEFAALLAKTPSDHRPVIIHVGFDWQYRTGFIPGAKHWGPASEKSGLEMLRKEMASVSRTKNVVLYCGCCPFKKCPNVYPALKLLKEMGFKHVRVVHLASNFKADWVDQHFPVSR